MTGAFASLAPAGDAMVALWMAVRTGPFSRAARRGLALASLVSTWAVCFVVSGRHSPRWMVFASLGALLISMALVLVVVVAQLVVADDGRREGGEDGDDGGPWPPDLPSGGVGPGEPSWWPEFERDFVSYVAQRNELERLRAPSATTTRVRR